MDIYSALQRAVTSRTEVVLATVIESHRSVPRHAGAKMLVHADGSIEGTIGGGEMESRVVAESLSALAARSPRRVSYSLVKPEDGDPGVCGGEVELYLEPHLPAPTVYLIGIGHVGHAVAELAVWLGNRVIAWDDRSDVAQPIDGVERVVSGQIEQALDECPIDAYTDVVVVTRNVGLDVSILPALLESPARFIGVMGSQRRWQTARSQLVNSGIAEAQLERITSPIGLDLQAETPAEIAVSILGQLIALARSPDSAKRRARS